MSMKWNGGSYLAENRKYYTATQVDSLVSGLVTGSHTHTNYQPTNANLTALSGLTGVSDRLAYFTGAGTMSLATFTALGRTLIGGATNTAMRSTLGLVIGTDVQAYSSLLTSFAGLTGSGYPKRATDGTWSFDATVGNYQPLNANLTAVSNIGTSTGYVRFTSANVITMDTNSYQPTSTNLTNLVALSTSGFIKKTGANTWGVDTNSYQPLDSDLTAIAGLTGSGYPKRATDGSWTLDAGTPGGTGSYQPANTNLDAIAGIGTSTGYVRFTSANTITMDPGPFQAGSTTLTNLVALTTNGFIKKTGDNSWGVDTASYQPLDSDLTAIAGLTGAGFAKRASDGSWSLDTASYQPSNTQLNSISSLSSSSTPGYLKRNSAGAYLIDNSIGLSAVSGIATGTSGTLRKGYNSTTNTDTVYPVKIQPNKSVTRVRGYHSGVQVLAETPNSTWYSNNSGAWKTWWVCDSAVNTPDSFETTPVTANFDATDVFSFSGGKKVITIPPADGYDLQTNGFAYYPTSSTVPTMVSLSARSTSVYDNVNGGGDVTYVITTGAAWDGKLTRIDDGGGNYSYHPAAAAGTTILVSPSGDATSSSGLLSGKLRFTGATDAQYGVTTWHNLPANQTCYLTLAYMSFSHSSSTSNTQAFNNMIVDVVRFNIEDSGVLA